MEEAHQEEALQEEVPQEEEPLEADLPEEDNHLHNKPKRHNQYLNKLGRDMNLYAAPKLKSSKETEQMPRNS